MQTEKYLDSLGREIQVGDIVVYCIGTQFIPTHGVVTKLYPLTQRYRSIELKAQIACFQHYDKKVGPEKFLKTLGGVNRSTVITELQLPNTPEFNAMRAESLRLLNVSRLAAQANLEGEIQNGTH